METFVNFTETEKSAVYEELLPQLGSLLEGETDLIANLANTTSVIKMAFPKTVSWVGFYLLRGNELVLGPFQGKPACVRIPLGRGVCGTSAQKREAIIVRDVTAFPGHIVCDPDARSEIVLPIIHARELKAVLDLDSSQLAAFDGTDQRYLSEVLETLVRSIKNWA